MRLFGVNPDIHFFQTVRAFADEFKLDAQDLIFTEKIIFDNYVSPMRRPSTRCCWR